MKHSLSILLQNHPGMLLRVAGVFAACGYNIDTLSVQPTQDAKLSRVILSLQCDPADLARAAHKARNLIDVINVTHSSELTACW